MNPTRAVMVWLVIIVVESIHGVLRVAFLQPLVGDIHARQIGVAVGSVLILAVAYALSPWMGVQSRRQLVQVGVLWVVLTLLFEFGVGRYAMDQSWERILSDYDPAQGGLMIVGIVFLAACPFIAARLRSHRAQAKPRGAA